MKNECWQKGNCEIKRTGQLFLCIYLIIFVYFSPFCLHKDYYLCSLQLPANIVFQQGWPEGACAVCLWCIKFDNHCQNLSEWPVCPISMTYRLFCTLKSIGNSRWVNHDGWNCLWQQDTLGVIDKNIELQHWPANQPLIYWLCSH